jgi:hypothetical protein
MLLEIKYGLSHIAQVRMRLGQCGTTHVLSLTYVTFQQKLFVLVWFNYLKEKCYIYPSLVFFLFFFFCKFTIKFVESTCDSTN